MWIVDLWIVNCDSFMWNCGLWIVDCGLGMVNGEIVPSKQHGAAMRESEKPKSA